jgi:PAS domain S-box-containing protein
LADVLESISDAFFALDHHWRFTYLNSAAERLLSQSRDALLGQNIWIEFAQAVGTAFDKQYHRAVMEQVTVEFEEYYPPLDTWFAVRAYPTPSGLSVYFQSASEARRTQHALRQSDERAREIAERLQFVLTAAELGDWDWDASNDLLRLSQRAADMFGVPPDPIRTRTEVRELIDIRDRERARLAAENVPANNGRYAIEYRVNRPDGRQVWISATGSSKYDPQGKLLGMAGVVQDITEQVAAREALAERERWLRGVLEATPECVKLVGPDGDLLFMNPSGLCMIETENEAAVRGACVFDLVVPEHRDRWRDMHRRVCAGEKLTWEFEIIGLKGTRRYMETHAVPLPLPDGRMAQLAVTRDVTRRNEGAKAQAHLASIVESSDDAIVSKSLDGVIRTWNSGARRIFGYAAEEVIGQSVLMLLPPDRHSEETTILARLRAGERIEHYESVRVAKDGRRIDVSLTISPVKDSEGHIIGASKVGRDITRQKEAERELQAAKAAADVANREKDELLTSERSARATAESASRMKDEFLATLSHELRTPLNAILGWSRILSSDPSAEDVVEGVKIIERNARVQTQIIEDLLDMSRIISGKIRLDVQRLDPATVLRAAVETVQPAANAKDIRIQAVLDSVAGPVSGDQNRLQQVFWNLLTNAVKFTSKGGRVQVVMERVNSHIEVSVIDTGDGISPEFLPFVFDRFRQADASTTRRHGGLGLGLAIVKQLVELHGGSVRVKSGGVGLGATFIVSLPLTVIHPEHAPEVERRHPEFGSVPMINDTCIQIEGMRILVVDDEQDARELVQRLLEDCKAVVTAAGSAKEAFDLLRSHRPDVLVSDIGMPSEDGYSLIRRVRALPHEDGGDTPAIALTAYARSEDRMKAVLAGFEQHVVKPVEPRELIAMIASLVRRRR